MTKLIHASEQLLKQQHPRIFGLQDPILQITSTLEIMGNKEFVQILHHGQNHWIIISTVGCSSNTVHVYDSLNLPFTKDLEAILADLLFTNNTHIILKNIKIQYQRGTNDCGLFAIATACAICNGHNPAELKFNQKCMRQHLLEC